MPAAPIGTRPVTFRLTGDAPSDATAVALSVTVRDPSASTSLRIYPSGGPPEGGNVDWVGSGGTVSSFTIVGLGAPLGP